MARILVTGGAGFIGSHLVDVLLADGHEVIALDNLFTGERSNLYQHLSNPRFEFLRHDVVEPILLEVDQVYHLACPASPVHYQYNPVKTIKTSVVGTINLLGMCKRVKGRMLLASTSEVYGDPLEHPQRESYWGNVNPIGLRSCYDEGKRVAETLTFCYQTQNGVDTRIVRIFNTYGPRMLFDDGRVVSNFIVQALKGEPISVYGEGSQTRSFCFVDDLVRGLRATMDKEGFHGPVNLGNPAEMTILELAKLVIEMTGSKSKISYKSLPKDDPVRRKPDISLAKKELGWEPKVALQAGLSKTIADFDARLKR
ncbi:MAG: SDR family oxidoreductase [Oligoflexia bacterium]|nr:SDR family oxidoreductase [Oligoflexia bacterium]